MNLKFIYGKKSSILKVDKVLLVASLLLLSLINFSSSATEPFSITEIKTDYGIAENTITLEITDLIDKDQYITNISEIFADHFLTDQIEIKEILLNQSYEADIKGYLNESQGKYKTVETVEEPYNCTSNNETNETTCLYHNVAYYYDDKSNLMDCDYVLGDKTCLKTVYGIVGTETKSDFLNLPTTKEKIKIAGLKIEQKQDGLSIPLPKGSTVQLKIRYSHPLAYNLEVPENVNKYDILMTTADGSVTLDPVWWNESYTKKLPLNCTNLDDLTPIVINGSGGFTINGEKQIVWTYCSGTGTAIYMHNSTDYTDYVVANDSTQLPFEVEFGNGTSYNPTSVWSNYGMVQHLSNINGSTSNNNNIVWDTNDPTLSTNCIIGNCYDFEADNIEYGSIQDSDSIDLVSNATLSGWVDLETVSDGVCFDKERNYRLIRAYSATQNQVLFGGTDWVLIEMATFSGWTVGNWMYVVITYNPNGTAIMYVNGTKDWSINAETNALSASTYDLYIGGYYTTQIYHPFDGKIDELRISGKLESAEYVNQTYQNAIGTSGYGNLLAEESAQFTMGGTVKDSSNIVVNNATIIIINQATNTITGTTNSNSTGGWTYAIPSTGTYLVVAYDPNNSTRDGDADPFIIVS